MVVDIEVFQRDEVGIAAVALGLDCIHRKVAAIEFQVAQSQMPHINQADRIRMRPRNEARRRFGGGRLNDDGPIGAPRQIVQRQAVQVIPRFEQQAVARLQAA